MVKAPTSSGIALLRQQSQRVRAREERGEDVEAPPKSGSASAMARLTNRKSLPSADDAGAAADRVHTSLYLTRDLWRRLRHIAAVEDCKVHDLVLEGIKNVVAGRPR